MGRYLLTTSAKAKEGREADYKDWYDKQHLGDMLKIPGVISARTYDAAAQSPQVPPLSFIAVYELELDDPNSVFAEIAQRIKSGEMPVSDAFEKGTSTTWIYEAR